MQASVLGKIARIDRWARHLVPGSLTLLLLVVELLPWGIAAPAIMPSLALMSLFYWAARLPALCPPLFALLAGALADLTELTPFGTQALIFVLVPLLLRQRRRRVDTQAFFGLWLAYGGVVLAATIFLWLMESLFAAAVLPMLPLLARVVLSVAVFPLLVRGCFMPVERLVRGNDP